MEMIAVTVGYMAMPADFRYKDVFLRGKPEIPSKHPIMDTGHRAKIFAPFAALRGFDEAVLSKDTVYTGKIMLDEDDMEEMDRRLGILQELTVSRRDARKNQVMASITYFVPCTDRNNPAYGYRGEYITVKDIVWNVDPIRKTVLLGKRAIPIQDIFSIEADGLFDEEWELEAP